MNSKYALGAVALSSAMFPLTEAFAGEMLYQVHVLVMGSIHPLR